MPQCDREQAPPEQGIVPAPYPEPQASDTNIVVAPDDSVYWVRYVDGDIGRYD